MKTNFRLILPLLLLLGLQVNAQSFLTQARPQGSKLWGYANEKGEIVIPAQYAKCYKFSPEGLAVIYDQKEKQYHFINTKGEKLTTEVKSFKLRDGFGFDVEGFKNGLIMIKVGEKWGYLDATGKLIIPARYEDANDFNDGNAAVKRDGKFYVLDTRGTETAVNSGDVDDIRSFSEGMAPFRTKDKRYGFINVDGNAVIPASFQSVGYFTNGLAWAKDADGKLGYINPKGEWVIKPQFSAGRDFESESGLARVKSGDRWGYVTMKGEMVWVDDTDSWGDFSEGLADGKKDDKRGFYNNKGEWVIKPKFDGTRDFKNGYAAAKSGDKWGMIDKQGNWIIQPTFEGIKDMEVIK